MKLYILFFLFAYSFINFSMEQDISQSNDETPDAHFLNIPEELRCSIFELYFKSFFDRYLEEDIPDPSSELKIIKLVCQRFNQSITSGYLNFYIKYLIIEKLRNYSPKQKEALVAKYKMKNIGTKKT